MGPGKGTEGSWVSRDVFLRHGGGKNGAAWQRQLHASAAQKRSSESSLWVRVRPPRGNICRLPIFLSDLTLATSTEGVVSAPVLFLQNPLLYEHIFFLFFSDTSVCEMCDPSALPQFLCGSTLGPAFSFLFFTSVRLFQALFLSRFSFIHRRSHMQIDRRAFV